MKSPLFILISLFVLINACSTGDRKDQAAPTNSQNTQNDSGDNTHGSDHSGSQDLTETERSLAHEVEALHGKWLKELAQLPEEDIKSESLRAYAFGGESLKYLTQFTVDQLFEIFEQIKSKPAVLQKEEYLIIVRKTISFKKG
jgi:hypothetical protein